MRGVKFPLLTEEQYVGLIAYYSELAARLEHHAETRLARARQVRSAEIRAAGLYYRQASCFLRGEVGRLRQRLAALRRRMAKGDGGSSSTRNPLRSPNYMKYHP